MDYSKLNYAKVSKFIMRLRAHGIAFNFKYTAWDTRVTGLGIISGDYDYSIKFVNGFMVVPMRNYYSKMQDGKLYSNYSDGGVFQYWLYKDGVVGVPNTPFSNYETMRGYDFIKTDSSDFMGFKRHFVRAPFPTAREIGAVYCYIHSRMHPRTDGDYREDIKLAAEDIFRKQRYMIWDAVSNAAWDRIERSHTKRDNKRIAHEEFNRKSSTSDIGATIDAFNEIGVTLKYAAAFDVRRGSKSQSDNRAQLRALGFVA